MTARVKTERDEAIKPCPFCGGDAAVRWNDGFPAVSCNDCLSSSGRYANGSERHAVAAWNRRVRS